jgi:N-carbamoylputrescine amidase
MPLTIACAQIAPLKAEVSANLDKIAAVALQAAAEGADLVLFPEAATTGYFLEGGVLESSLTTHEVCEGLKCRISSSLTRPLDVCLGFYENAEGQLFNAAGYFSLDKDSCKVLGTYRKFFLPTYGVFDEERFVTRGRALGVFDTRFGKMGMLICEDVWHSILPTLTALAGAQILLVPTASPARGFGDPQITNLDRYQRLLRGIAEEHGLFCVNTQLCGFEGGKGFVGGSMVIDPMGRVMVQSPVGEEHLLLATLDMDLIRLARAQSPLISDLQEAWGDVKEIVADL